MEIAEIIKNKNFFKKLEEKTLSNSLLFYCEDDKTSEVTLILTALMLNYKTYALMNENSAEYKRVLNGADLDIKIYPKNKEKLLVSDSNEIVDEVFIKPTNKENKVFIIENIDLSTTEAQNKLLKVLEEPPKNVYFLISAKQADRVLPTIKSRCDKITIEKLPLSEIEKVCKNPLVCMLCEGYVGKAEELSKNSNLNEIVDFAVSLVCDLKNSAQVLRFSKHFQELKGDIDLILKIYSFCLEDMLKIKTEIKDYCLMKMFLPKIESVESEFSVQAICEILNLITFFRKKLEFNANLSVAIDNLLLKILEVKYICK